MRLLFFTLFLLTAIHAENYVLKGHKGQSLHFAPDPQRSLQSGQKERVFYREGYVSESAKVVTTGYLKIRLDGHTDPQTFAQKHGVAFVKTLDGRLYLFKNTTPLNDMALAAKLAKVKGVVGAIPRFQGRKSLK